MEYHIGMDFDFKKLRLPLIQSLCVGIACGFLDFVLSVIFVDVLKLPFYMDCIFTVAASFVGILPGLVSAVLVHVFRCFISDTSTLFYIVCSASVVPCVRFFLNRPKEMPFILAFFLMVAAMSVLISIEGGIIYKLLFEFVARMETRATNSMILSLFINGIPLLLSSIVGRIPVNFFDKLIACIGGYWAARLFVLCYKK